MITWVRLEFQIKWKWNEQWWLESRFSASFDAKFSVLDVSLIHLLYKTKQEKERLGLKRLLKLLELPRTWKEEPIIVKLEFIVYSRQIILTPSSLGFTM
jgi:hypothetical protein